MGYYCTVPQCTSLAGKTKNVKFHRFPRDHTMADKWNLILKRGKPYTKYSKVCSLHFTPADYNVTTMGQWKTLSKDAVPSQNLPKLNPDGTVMVIRKSRTVKYKEGRKEENVSDKSDKWYLGSQTSMPVTSTPERILPSNETSDNNLAYRLQTINAIANNMMLQHQNDTQSQNNTSNPNNNQVPSIKPKKQDAFMQTDPIQSEEDETQPNNSYSESSEKSFNSDHLEQYSVSSQYSKETESFENQIKKFEMPKDYTKTNEDYIPQTNEEYNKEAEKYALERKSLNGMEIYQKPVIESDFQKLPDMYAYNDKQQEYPNRNDNYIGYTNGYTDSAEILRNQQHNLQLLQEPHRITENQNFFNESHIKQEIDFGTDDDKFLYERPKDQLETNAIYSDDQRHLEQQRLLDHIQQQVKQEPDTNGGCENVMQPQGSPYYTSNGHNVTGVSGYYEQISRPGPELLIAKQNALAAHTQLWTNTMKRPFFYSDSAPYTGPQVLHRYEDITRILQ